MPVPAIHCRGVTRTLLFVDCFAGRGGAIFIYQLPRKRATKCSSVSRHWLWPAAFGLVDGWARRAAEQGKALDIQYEELIYAKMQGQAGERSPDHPMAQLYRERHDTLVKASYLKTCEFPLQHGFQSGKASSAFLYRFATSFPDVDVQIQNRRDSPPVIVVCA